MKKLFCNLCKKEIKRGKEKIFELNILRKGCLFDEKTSEYDICEDCVIELKKLMGGKCNG